MTTAAKPKTSKYSRPRVLAVCVAVVLAGAIVTHHIITAVLVAAVALTALVLYARVRWARYAAGGWIAARRRRKYQGWAGFRDVRRAARTAAKLTRRLTPGTSLMILGTRGWSRQRIAVCRENSALFVGPPGMGKSGVLADLGADAPGALLAASTKTELFLDTFPYRAGKGRIWILNPDGYGNIPTTLAWSPLEGCISPQVAIRRAGDFTSAAPKNGGQNGDAGDYWAGKGAELLAVAFHAAAVAGQSMYEVREWVRDPYNPALETAYAMPGADWMLAGDLTSLLTADPEYVSSVIKTAEAALSWMRDDVMAAAASPAPGEGFSAWEFARSTDSVYLIGEERPHGSFAPYFAALGAEVFEQLKGYAMESPSGRLPVPATFVLDEMPLTCPLPVHRMLAHARGFLITITMGIQSWSQLRAKWGDADGDTIRSACPVEVFFGGEKRYSDLKVMSGVMDQKDTWTDSKDNGGGKARTPGSEPLLPPGALRVMRKGRAAILMPECKPVLADLPAIWKRKGHRRADLGHATALLASQATATVVSPAAPAVTGPVPALTGGEPPS